MATRKITVLNPAGYQEIFQTGDNLLVDGDINLQSNSLTGVPSPSNTTDATNKSYVDTADSANGDLIQANTNSINTHTGQISTNTTDISSNASDIQDNADDITAIDGRVTTLETAVPPAANDSTISFIGDNGITFPSGSSFTVDQPNDGSITIAGPDLSAYLQKPGVNGTFVITEANGSITFEDTIDCGEY